jgi:hypothetical protein
MKRPVLFTDFLRLFLVSVLVFRNEAKTCKSVIIFICAINNQIWYHIIDFESL